MPAPVTTGRATIVDAEPVTAEEAERWLATVTLEATRDALAVLMRAVGAYRIAAGEPGVPEPRLEHALAVRAGYGRGEAVAEGRWSDARELTGAAPRQRRHELLRPQERLAALLAGRARVLACEELALRARADLDAGRVRVAALELRAALAAAASELPREPGAAARLGERLADLEARRGAVDALAEAALDGAAPPPGANEALAETLGRLEAALRARAAAYSQAQVETET